MDACIYQIRNTVNGKLYIGSAVNFLGRCRQHRHDLRHGKHGNSILQRAWRKYGATAFVFSKLLVCSKTNLLFYEQRALDALNPDYNICLVAGNSLGLKRSKEARARIGAAARGRPTSALQKRRTSETHKGKPKSAEHRAKISAALAGRKPAVNFAGRKHTAETRAKMSAAKKGRASPNMARVHSPEKRLLHSIFMKQWWSNHKGIGE